VEAEGSFHRTHVAPLGLAEAKGSFHRTHVAPLGLAGAKGSFHQTHAAPLGLAGAKGSFHRIHVAPLGLVEAKGSFHRTVPARLLPSPVHSLCLPGLQVIRTYLQISTPVSSLSFDSSSDLGGLAPACNLVNPGGMRRPHFFLLGIRSKMPMSCHQNLASANKFFGAIAGIFAILSTANKFMIPCEYGSFNHRCVPTYRR
jgi:hypothetical protein